MPLKTFDSLDAIPDAQRSAAIETKAGKFILEEPGDAEALKDEGRRAVQAERNKAKTEKERADALQAEIDRLKTDSEAAQAGISAQKLQEIRDRELKPLQDENRTLKERVDSLEHTINFTKSVEDLARKSNVMVEDEGRFEDFMSTVQRRTRKAPDGKSYIVLDRAGNETTQTLDELISKTLPAEKSHLYKSGTGSGSGAGQGGGGASGYDPVAEGKRMAAAEKRTADDKSLALK